MIKKINCYTGLDRYVFEVLTTSQMSEEKAKKIQEIVFDKNPAGYDFFGFKSDQQTDKGFYLYTWSCYNSCD